jgi:hypothetical protein
MLTHKQLFQVNKWYDEIRAINTEQDAIDHIQAIRDRYNTEKYLRKIGVGRHGKLLSNN